MSLPASAGRSPALVATRRSPTTVALDLRVAGQAAAVAVDGRGALAAWTVVSGGGDVVALARRALRELRVRPAGVRVLLGAAGAGGAGAAQVAVLAQAAAPGEGEIAAALFAEGYERLNEPSVAALAVSPETWLVAACGAEAIEPLAAGLREESGTEPAFVVDQLLAAGGLQAGAALVEYGETGLLIAADPPGAAPLVRSLPATFDLEEAARESRESLQAAGFGGAVQVCGPHRAELARLLAASGVPARAEALPASGGETLPAACELAWQLALRPTVPRLASPRGERRRASLGWARRAVRLALVLAALGGLLMAAGLRLAWVSRGRNRALVSRAAGDARLVERLRQLGTLAEAAGRLRSELAGQTPPWPPLAEPLAALARQLPPEVGWERLRIQDGTLELEAAAGGPAPWARLELLRHALERSPGVVDLSWAAPAAPAARAASATPAMSATPATPATSARGARLRQVFRAALRGAPAAAPRGAP
jgi:hypothetical protein